MNCLTAVFMYVWTLIWLLWHGKETHTAFCLELGGGGVHVNQDINHASDQPQACPHINIILCVSVAVHRSDQLSTCPLSTFLFNFDLPIPTVGWFSKDRADGDGDMHDGDIIVMDFKMRYHLVLGIWTLRFLKKP